MSSLPTLVADRLKKRIGRKTIVEDISFEIMPGEIFGFLGPNGAGKTTTIRMLVGLIRPTEGRVTVCGHDVHSEFEQAMRCIGCIVETPDLYRFMSGRENLEHFARMIGGVSEQDIDEAASLVDLSHRLEDKVSTYSLGMRQRLGIAQAVLGKPRLLILDEPANGLDPAGIREIRQLMKNLASERNISVFISSHLLSEIEILCDRVAIIHRGRIIRTSSVRELIESRNEVVILCDRSDEAASILRQASFEVSVDQEALTLTATPEKTAEAVRLLSEAGISMFEVRRTSRTLEESFLEVTGGETVVN